MPDLTREMFDELVERAEEGTATAEELEALEPYRARRAVMLASGFGSRMMPVTAPQAPRARERRAHHRYAARCPHRCGRRGDLARARLPCAGLR